MISFKTFFSIVIPFSICLTVMGQDVAEKKVIKEEDLASFTKDAKFDSEGVGQDKIDKEMAILENKGKDANSDFIMLLDECAKLPDEASFKACKQKVITNK